MGEDLYLAIWRKVFHPICDAIEQGKNASFQMNKADFEKAGNRENSGYNIRVDFSNGKVTNNISGSAVARDLVEALTISKRFRDIAADKKLIFKMNDSFTLKMEVIK